MNNRIRVLLVDDEQTFALNMARLLRVRGFAVTTAFNGLEALDVLDTEAYFDVVVLDVKMPGMNGLAVLSEIKRLTPKTEVIMLTGHATVDSGIQSIRQGAFDYLMKPCDIELLADKIREACEVERMRRQPVLWPRNRVREIPLPSFLRLRTHDPLVKALDVFRGKSGMPAEENLYVLDADDRLAGVVCRGDLLAAAQKTHPEHALVWRDVVAEARWLPTATLGDVMRPEPPMATDREANLTAVARQMIADNLRCMPVVDGERVVGFIRLQDIFQYGEQEIA